VKCHLFLIPTDAHIHYITYHLQSTICTSTSEGKEQLTCTHVCTLFILIKTFISIDLSFNLYGQSEITSTCRRHNVKIILILLWIMATGYTIVTQDYVFSREIQQLFVVPEIYIFYRTGKKKILLDNCMGTRENVVGSLSGLKVRYVEIVDLQGTLLDIGEHVHKIPEVFPPHKSGEGSFL